MFGGGIKYGDAPGMGASPFMDQGSIVIGEKSWNQFWA